ncbi:MAG: nickel pincer cofactor biosynthesis protein LarC [Methanocorpusculum sp.]|nr:nickel pincer cofactor biosynthesis protein LarC [Methanocorpusculum sp.]MDD3912806.1 nickel pincer cofactor biosynthesis protein LarC [Methanocorpusculum sp.]MDD4424024.1 nickel pincer cofactor biosynthesis protein LarC [Methanocorpusculum parvum]
MRILVLDPRFGAAGDMILGALLSLGADKDFVLRSVSTVSKPDITEVTRAGIPATYIRTNTGKSARNLQEVLAVISAADAPEKAKEIAKQVFYRIQKAEAHVHQTEHVHFHEVGADDAISDILGSVTALLSLQVDGVHILPVSVGSGTLKCSHGIMPVPAPATAEILKASALSVSLGSFEGELCTPTGAALLAAFQEIFGTHIHTGRLIASGSGAGTRDPADHPNVLLAYILDTEEKGSEVDVLETNVDDVSGELLASVLSTMMHEGARDASVVPIVMKKGRPGHLIRVISLPADSGRLAKILARETGSLGIRCIPMVHRFIADRTIAEEHIVINDKVFAVNVKTASMDGAIYSRKAEFDDLQRIADASGISVRTVKRIVEEDAWKTQ